MSSNYNDLVAQAHRLLRIKWDNPASLAEELYSMLMPGVGDEMPGITQIPGQSAATVEVQRRLEQARQFFETIDRSTTVNAVRATVVPPPGIGLSPPEVFSPPPPPPPRREEPAPRPVEPPAPPPPPPPFSVAPPAPFPPLVSAPPTLPLPFLAAPRVAAQDLSYSRPDLDVPRLPDVDWTVPVAHVPLPAEGAGGGGGILGQVVSGSGDTYVVDLYEDGKNSAATQSGVTVMVPQIADGEKIPEGTWIAPVLEGTNPDTDETERWYQPPIWIE